MIEIAIIWSLIKLLTLLSLGLIATIYVLRLRKIYLQKKHLRIERLIQKPLATLIVKLADHTTEEVSRDENFLKIKKLCKTNRSTEILIRQLMKSQNVLEYSSLGDINKVFLAFGLQEYGMKNIRHKSTTKKIKALKFMASMKCHRSVPYVTDLLNDNRSLLRSEALISFVSLAKDPLYFLEDRDVKLSLWDQIRIHRHLIKLDPAKIPDFGEWLNHPQISVVQFCLKMILEFKQFRADKQLKALLANTKNAGIQMMVLNIIIKLQLVDLENEVLLIVRNTKNSRLLRMAIAVLGEIGSKARTRLMLGEFVFHPNSKISQAARRSLTTIKLNESRLKRLIA